MLYNNAVWPTGQGLGHFLQACLLQPTLCCPWCSLSCSAGFIHYKTRPWRCHSQQNHHPSPLPPRPLLETWRFGEDWRSGQDLEAPGNLMICEPALQWSSLEDRTMCPASWLPGKGIKGCRRTSCWGLCCLFCASAWLRCTVISKVGHVCICICCI